MNASPAAATHELIGTPVIELVGVSKDYPSEGGVVRALRDTTLTIRMGELVAIIGTSGSGKSTMMNILGCLDRPTRGIYRLAGLDVGGRSGDARALVRNRLIGFIFQGFNLLNRTTALENVELPLRYRGVGRTERKRRAKETLEAVGLATRLDHKSNELSGGQQQRVAIARALVTNPPILLADEPTGNLDTRTSLEVLAFLQRLNRTRGITVVLVTHEPDIAACAGRIITVRDGRVVSDTENAPSDAAALLAALPPTAAASAFGSTLLMQGRPRQRNRIKIPAAVYLSMMGGALAGVLCGLAYDAWVLDHWTALPPLVGSLVGECAAGARTARRRLGRFTPTLAARIAVSYTVVVSLVLGLVISQRVQWWPSGLADRLAVSGKGGALAFLVGVVLLAGLAILRALLLSLFARR